MKNSQNSANWYWAKQGYDERNGPVSRERLEELAEEGELEPEDLVWREEMDDWVEARSAEELEDLFVSPPPLPDESSQEDVEEDVPPPLPQSEKDTPPFPPQSEGSEAAEEYNFPVEFEVIWGGSVSSSESTLQLRRNEISLRTNDWANAGGSIPYDFFEIKEVRKKTVTFEAPAGFNTDVYNKEHSIEFKFIWDKKEFLDSIEEVKQEVNFSNKDLSIRWYWSKQDSDEQNGPVSLERIEELAEQGDLEPEDLIGHRGFEDWKEAGSVEEVEELFASPSTLPDDRASEGEAISCIHDYTENNVCKKCGWSKEKLKELSKRNSSDAVESDISEKQNREEEGEVDATGNNSPTLPGSEPDDDSRATKSEALSCIHEHDKNDICQKCGWSRRELKGINGETNRNSEKKEDESSKSWSDSLKAITILVVLGYILNSCIQGCGGGSDSEIYAVDSISGKTAYMSHQLQSDPRELSGAMLSGWKQNFNDNLGEDVYYAVEEIKEGEMSDVGRIRVLLTMDECKNIKTGNVSTNVPSGSLVIEGFGDIIKSNDAEAFTQSLTWQAEWQTGLLSRTGDEFDECSGSFE